MKPRTYTQFEKMVQHYGLRPQCKVVEPDGTEILIADGFVEPHGELWKRQFRAEYPNGLWQTLWAIYRGGFDVASWVEFDANHDRAWSEPGRQEGRINAALGAARQWIKMSAKRYGAA